MESLNSVYQGFRRFVDDFANTSTSSFLLSPEKKENLNAWYAEWDDNYIGDIFNNALMKKTLRKIADTYYGDQLDTILEEATELSPDSYPMLSSIYLHCCDTLGMYIKPKAYITGRMKGINALSLDVKRKQIILISPMVAIKLMSEEQAFLLGHEIGHHQQGNLVCHTVNGLVGNVNNASDILGPLLLSTIEVPLKRWCRCSEFNADRAGYLCCRNEEAIKQLFNKLGMSSCKSAYADFKEIGDAHPLLQTRWNMINNYILKTL